nr:MAG TPA: STRUCTURAL MAINTENANCE OF CHROMOSOMES PROTEIN [Caudoviricetes sp.]
MSVKINKLEIENVKRVRALTLEPGASGLTVVGGRNGQGKTSVLDAIAWALGGDRYRPTQPQREGSVVPPSIRVRLSNGLLVERKGKNSTLKVTDPTGTRYGQQLLDDFVTQLALDLPKFLQATPKEKAQTLLKVIGVGDQLDLLDREEAELYSERLLTGRIAQQKGAAARELPEYPDAPRELISAAELIHRQQNILARNGENARKRARTDELARAEEYQRAEVARLQKALEKAEATLAVLVEDLRIARRDALELRDESTAELEESILQIDEINRKVRANLDRDRAEAEAQEASMRYCELNAQIEKLRERRRALLESASLPLPGLTVEKGELRYNGFAWDNLSGAEQLRVGTAIVRALNPRCGFVLLDKLEQMDVDTLRDFAAWLEGEGLQAIATRVSTGEECQIIIEDGMALAGPPNERPKWKAGEF